MGFGYVAVGEPLEKLAYWHLLLGRHFGALTCFPLKLPDFHAQLFVGELADCEISTITAQPAAYRFDPPTKPSNDLLVYLALGNPARLERAGVTMDLGRGDVAVVDLREGFRLSHASPAQAVVLRMPASALNGPVGRVWSAIRGQRGTGAVLRAVLSEVAAQDRLAAPEQVAARRTIVDLMNAVLSDSLVSPSSTGGLQRAQRYMTANLHDADLNAERVASAVGLSTRSLYRLFSDEGTTFMRWLLIQRVEASRAALASGHCRDVTDAALSHGFKDLSHFSRVFRKRFGQSPSSVQRPFAANHDPYTAAFVRNSRHRG